MQKKSIVYSQPNCVACNTVKAILKMHGYEVEERVIGEGEWTKAKLLAVAPNARSVPQVFVNDELVGGLAEVSRLVQK